MIAGIAAVKGDSYTRGFKYGQKCKKMIDINVRNFWDKIAVWGYRRQDLITATRQLKYRFLTDTLEEIRGLADGSMRNFEEMLALNLYYSSVFPEDCTVMMAVGNASASGYTIMAKNSDKAGNESLVGDLCYKNKEINIVHTPQLLRVSLNLPTRKKVI